jgi:spore maturation protein CgeB
VRIFYAAENGTNSAAASKLWHANLHDTLVAMGHDVVSFDFDFDEVMAHRDHAKPEHKAWIQQHRPGISAELERQIRTAHAEQPIDCFFAYFYDACCEPATLDRIRSLGIVSCNWYCNASFQLHLVSEIAPHFDYCLVPEAYRMDDYRALGAKPIYCQEAGNPDVYHPVAVSDRIDVAFVGQAYGERPAIVRYLLDHGIDITAFGPFWDHHQADAQPGILGRLAMLPGKVLNADRRRHMVKRVGRLFGKSTVETEPSSDGAAPSTVSVLDGINPVLPASAVGGILSDADLVATFSRARINLGFSAVDEDPNGERIVQIRLRDFEIPLSGGFYLSEYQPEIEEFFEVGKEIACYESIRELPDRIAYYLSHEDEREAIAAAGRQRCLAEHTWHHRFEAVFAQMGLDS